MNFEWQYPEAFWLLLLPVFFSVLYLFYRRWKRKTTVRIGDPDLVKTLFRNHSPKKEILKFVFIVAAFAVGCIALANPRKPDQGSSESRAGIDIFIALDVSNSMLATDVPPVRLQRAKQFLTSMIDNMPNDRFGLILFAGHAYLQMPLSTDHEAAKMFISTADPSAVAEQGTALTDVFDKAEDAFDKTDRFKTIVLVTDGETHDDDAIASAKELAKEGVMINTVGIGSVDGSTIIDPKTKQAKKDDAGNIVISKLNQQLLQDLATLTHGTYVHLDDPSAGVTALLEQYKDVQKKALPDVSSMTFISYYWWFVLPMFLLLLAEIFVPDRKKVEE